MVSARGEIGVGPRCFGERVCFHDVYGAQQNGIETLDALEIDLRDLHRRDLLFPDKRGQAMRGKESEIVGIGRHSAAPLRHRKGRALECCGATLFDELFHQHAGATGIRLEGPRHRNSHFERGRWRGLRTASTTTACTTLSKQRFRAESECARGRGCEREKDKFAPVHTSEVFGFLRHLLGFGLHLIKNFQLLAHAHLLILQSCSCDL